MNILGIETSCDETAAAVVSNGTQIKSSVVSSQIDIHHKYGGVVPELASRKHIENIVPVVKEAVSSSGLKLEDINGVAATQGPGLVGALLVGFTFGKSVSYANKIPFIGVNHLEGHITSVFLESDPPEFPYVALLVSGGHTNIYYVSSHTKFSLMGQTRDDAVGEAYDKVSKMLGFGYPGGKILDDIGKKGDPEKILFPKPYMDKSKFDFSFSGLKTSVSRYIKDNQQDIQNQIPDIVAGFQKSVVDVLSYKLFNATVKKKCKHIALVGGVAANSSLRKIITQEAKKRGLRVYIPDIDLCGDNAAMIASTGYYNLLINTSGTLYKEDVYSRPKVTIGKKHK